MSEAERAIREALPFATPGRWEHVFFNGGREHYVYAPAAHYRRDLPGPVKVAWLPYSPGSNRDANNAVYIAACNPGNIAALLAERDALREALTVARDYVAADLDWLREAYRGYETAGRVPETERDLASIDAVLATGEGNE